MPNTLPLSVVIPCYRDWHALQRCLDALTHQSLPADQFEIVVVDNGGGDERNKKCLLPDNARVVVEPRPGAYAARNTGCAAARGQFLALTDADCVPRLDWLSQGFNYLLAGADRVAGRIVIVSNRQRLGVVEAYESVVGFNQIAYVEAGWGATANLFIRKRILDEVGGFRGDLLSGGDYEWGTRASTNGFGLRYAEDVVVDHPPRATLKALLKKRRRIAGGWRPSAGTGCANWGYGLALVRDWLPSAATTQRIVMANNIPIAQKIVLVAMGYGVKLYTSVWRMIYTCRRVGRPRI